MKATRPALAYRLERITDELATLEYDEAQQISRLPDGNPAVVLPGAEIKTFAERDRPEPSTSTEASRDPGDLDALAWPVSLAATATETRAGRDTDDDEPNPSDPSTMTKAARDPGDLDAPDWSSPHLSAMPTETQARRHSGEPADPESFADDLVTGVVAF
jgi:hypothetical protein